MTENIEKTESVAVGTDKRESPHVNDFDFSLSEDQPMERARSVLEAADIDDEQIVGIEVSVRYTDVVTRDGTDPGETVFGNVDEDDQTSEDDPDVEVGPVEEEDQGPNPTPGYGTGKGKKHPGKTRKEDAVMPYTKMYAMLEVLENAGDDEWKTAVEIEEEMDADGKEYISHAHRKRGFTRRRKSDETGVIYEYQLSTEGSRAMRRGEEEYDADE